MEKNLSVMFLENCLMMWREKNEIRVFYNIIYIKYVF